MAPTITPRDIDRLIVAGETKLARHHVLADEALFISWAGGLELAEPMHTEFISHDSLYTRCLDLYPAGFGKSTLGSKWRPLYRAYRNPNIRILCVMKTDEDAKAYAEGVHSEIENNERLLALFGNLRGDPWTIKGSNLSNRQIRDQHYTFEFYGMKPSVLGHRCHLLVLDDIVTDENSATPGQRDKVYRWFMQTARTAPRYLWGRTREGRLKVPEGIYWPANETPPQIMAYGTRFHFLDLYAKLMKDPTFTYFIYDCYTDESKSESSWPEGMTVAELHAEEKADLISFNKRYRNRPVDEANAVFKQVYIEGGEYNGVVYRGCKDEERSTGDFDENHWLRAAGFDPASGKKKVSASHPAQMVCGMPDDVWRKTAEAKGLRTYRLYLIDRWSKQGIGIEEQLTALFEGDEIRELPGFCARYHPQLIRIEANSQQQMIFQLERLNKSAMRWGVRVEEHQTQGSTKWDPLFGIKMMQELFMNGQVSIPWKNASDQEKWQPVVDQLLQFPEGSYDDLMALWFAWRGLEENITPPQGFYPEGFSGDFIVSEYWEGEGEEGKGEVDYGYLDDRVFY